MSSQTILVTGGAGYIGSHTVVALIEQGHQVIIFDNLVNASAKVVVRISELTGTVPPLIRGDIRDNEALDYAFSNFEIDAVIHFAGLKAVGESVEQPLTYYEVNVGGTINLLQAMDRYDVRTIVFSSSATVYGTPEFLPYTEDHPLSPLNPYGRTKLMIEDILRDLHTSDPQWRIRILRYFNPCGAHPSGEIGEDPKGVPNNLMPYIAQVATGRREQLNIWGADYDTPDGTGVRDYIHVMDLAEGHLAALDHLKTAGGCLSVNLGAGTGYSVLQMVSAFEQAAQKRIPYTISPRRAGDLPAFWADASLAKSELGWRVKRSLDDMCRDHWNWQRSNPNGYDA